MVNYHVKWVQLLLAVGRDWALFQLGLLPVGVSTLCAHPHISIEHLGVMDAPKTTKCVRWSLLMWPRILIISIFGLIENGERWIRLSLRALAQNVENAEPDFLLASDSDRV